MKRKKERIFTAYKMTVSVLILCLVLTSVPFQARAGTVTESEVRQAVETWVRYVTADSRPDAMIEKMEPYLVEEQIVAYIAHLSGGGFCLCGADDVVLPVYWYSPKGVYDPEDPHNQYFLWEIAARTENLRRGLKERDSHVLQYEEALLNRKVFWQDLVAGHVPARSTELSAEPVMMELDVTSLWHQGSPYNDRCPLLSPPDERTVVGCGATAAAQIMHYWKWPHTGVSTGSVNYHYRWRSNWDEEPLATDPNIAPNWGGGGRLEWTSASGGRLRMNGYWDSGVHNAAVNVSSDPGYQTALANLWNRMTQETTICNANFGATTYNWNLIGDVHSDPPDAGDAEVAKLCYHVGIASDMDYGIWGSGCALYVVQTGFVDHFRYDPGNIYDVPDINVMTKEIQWLRPFEFSGCSAPHSCHMFVVYGYNKNTDPDRQFMMSMGHGGGDDGWFSLDSVPYDLYQKHLTNIAPLNVVRFVGDTNPGDGSPSDPHEDIEEALASAPDNATLIFKAGSTNTFSAASLTIDRPLTLKGHDVTIRNE